MAASVKMSEIRTTTRTPSHRLHVLIFIVILSLMPCITMGLRCYQCYSNSVEPCPYEDLQECPRFSFYNRCSVKVRKMITGEMFVKRECSLGCSDGSDSWNRELNMSHFCDRSRPEYECKVCCRGDGCNYSGASGLSPSSSSIISLLLLTMIVAFKVMR